MKKLNPYEMLQSEYDDEIHFCELPYQIKGLCCNNFICVSSNIDTTKEKYCVLAEEIGHYKTTVGNILDQTNIRNSKQEKQARSWGYEKIVSLRHLIAAYEKGCTNIYEMAEFLNVTDEYFCKAIEHYKDKYGVFTTCDEYILFFDPIFRIVAQRDKE